MAVGTVANSKVVDVTSTPILEGVVAKVTFNSVAIIKVTASEVADVIIAPMLEGVNGKVKVLPVVVTGCCFLQRGRDKAAGTRGVET